MFLFLDFLYYNPNQNPNLNPNPKPIPNRNLNPNPNLKPSPNPNPNSENLKIVTAPNRDSYVFYRSSLLCFFLEYHTYEIKVHNDF